MQCFYAIATTLSQWCILQAEQTLKAVLPDSRHCTLKRCFLYSLYEQRDRQLGHEQHKNSSYQLWIFLRSILRSQLVSFLRSFLLLLPHSGTKLCDEVRQVVRLAFLVRVLWSFGACSVSMTRLILHPKQWFCYSSDVTILQINTQQRALLEWAMERQRSGERGRAQRVIRQKHLWKAGFIHFQFN